MSYVICLKAGVCSAVAKIARQAANTTLHAVNELVLIMYEEPHNLLPDI